MLRPLFGSKDPMLSSINPDTKRELLRGHYPVADAQLTAALRTDSLNLTLCYLRGACRGRLKQWAAAEVDFTHAIQFDSTDGWFYVGRANCHFALRHVQLARRDYELAFKRTPSCHSDPDATAQAGVKHLFLNDLPQANEELELASVLDRRNDFALFYLAVARTISHQPQAAASSCREYIKWHAKRPEGYVNRALLRASLGEYQPAFADIALALSIDPTHKGSALAKVVITELNGNHSEANVQLASILAKSSNKDSIYLDLGDYYMQVGKNTAANQQWTTARLLGNAEAAERLAAQFHDAP